MSIETIISEVNSYDDAFINAIKLAEERLTAALSVAIAEGKLERVSDLNSAIAEVQRYMDDTGYYTLFTNDDRYQYYLIKSAEMLTTQGATGIQYSELTLQELQTLKEARYLQAISVANSVRDNIAQGVLDIRFGGMTRQSVIEGLVATGLPNARTIVDTANVGFYNTAHEKLCEDIGIEQFEYMGPYDVLTRPFCREHVGETGTQEYWNSLDNGQGLPVFTYGGGYNCRHRLVGVINE